MFSESIKSDSLQVVLRDIKEKFGSTSFTAVEQPLSTTQQLVVASSDETQSVSDRLESLVQIEQDASNLTAEERMQQNVSNELFALCLSTEVKIRVAAIGVLSRYVPSLAFASVAVVMSFVFDRYFDLPVWYNETTVPLTYRTNILSLSRAQAEQLVSLHTKWNTDYAGCLCDLQSSSIDPLWADIASQVQQSLGEFGGTGFVRLSTRSPKDAIMLTPLYHELLSEAEEKCKEEPSLYTELSKQCLVDAGKVNNWPAAFALLICSDRVAQDASLALSAGNLFSLQLLVREFAALPASSEFRVFVRNGAVTAISQYHHKCHFADVVQNKHRLRDQILSFVSSQVLPHLPYQTCVLDTSVVLGGEANVIEVNPFSRATDACMFSWTRDEDVLLRGSADIRVNEAD